MLLRYRAQTVILLNPIHQLGRARVANYKSHRKRSIQKITATKSLKYCYYDIIIAYYIFKLHKLVTGFYDIKSFRGTGS